MITTQINKPTNKPAEFFGKLFQIRDQMHINHLRISGTGSYAGHIAIHDLYDGLLDLTDTLIESYQGKYGIVDINIPASTKTEPITTLKELAKLTDGGAVYSMFKETWLQNQIDEISTLCYQTIYKLENLK
jgi:hypothetical protein